MKLLRTNRLVTSARSADDMRTQTFVNAPLTLLPR